VLLDLFLVIIHCQCPSHRNLIFLTRDQSEETLPEAAGSSMNGDPDFSACDTAEPHVITQAKLTDLVKDLDLPKT